MGSQTQRFCLRWNNHQSNLLSVFDQLLHEEAFVDVTLAVEGQYLRAHKMVLSACSPYFQTLFVGHPDKHPIVILKDVPYSDMRSLLDFMYRGEVSVDQDRLTAFLKVAESLKIKGLTEVNEESCDLPSIANSLLGTVGSPPQQVPQQAVSPQVPQQGSAVPQQPQVSQPSPVIPAQGGLPPPAVLAPPNTSTPVQHPPPPNLHRLPLPRRVSPSSFSALGVPRRKRGRPRKLDCSGPTPLPLPPSTQPHELPHSADIKYNNVEHNHVHEMANGTYTAMKKENATDDDGSQQGALKKEDKMDDDDKMAELKKETSVLNDSTNPDKTNCVDGVKSEPTPSTSSQDGVQEFQNSTADGECFLSSRNDGKGIVRVMGARAGSEDGVVDMELESDSDSLIVDGVNPDNENGDNNNTESKENPLPVKRRNRRRAASSSDPAEALTEMSVRGLNLFRYASIDEGLYKCTECAKADVLKTFKNKYSFQRHAFLYHEGHQRKVFPCPVCCKEFSRPDKMKNHMKTVHDCFMPKEIIFPPVSYYMPQ